MHARLKPWLAFSLVALGIGGVVYGIYAYRYRFVHSNPDMLALLPSQKAILFFVDVTALRRAGLLQLLTGSKAATEPEYQEFVRQTHFDYSRDVQVIAGTADSEAIYCVLRGRFEWGRLREYAAAHGGSCDHDVCKVPSSRARKWIGYFAIQPNVLALALSKDAVAVEALRPEGRGYAGQFPADAVWLEISSGVLQQPQNLPAGLRIFAIALQPANSVIFSLMRPVDANGGAAFELQLRAPCPNPATAETVRNQLEIQTKMLKLELMREHQQANAADLTGLLTSGSFRVVNRDVVGVWPVRRELLKTLE